MILDSFRMRLLIWTRSLRLRRLQSQAYWENRRSASRVRFEGKRLLHRYTQGTVFGRRKAALLLRLVRLSLGPLLLAISLFLIALLLERPEFLAHWARLEDLLAAIHAREGMVDPQVYSAFLSVVASVAGIFLGLYFAAATTVIGSAYSRAPKSIRELVITDPAGSFYASWLCFITMLALLLLAHVTIAKSPNLLGFGIVVLLAAPTGFVAFALGRHTLGLLDPSNLMLQIRRGWRAAVDAIARPVGLGTWPEGQDFNRRNAVEWIRCYADLISYCGREPDLREGPLQTTAISGLAFLAEYQGSRLRIPSQSRWFARLQTYGPMYLASGTELDIADASGTLPGPLESLDSHWFDREIMNHARQAFEVTLTSGRGGPASRLIDMAAEVFQQMASSWECSLATEELIRWRDVYATVRGDSLAEGAPTPALADSIGNSPIGLVLGFSRGLERFSVAEIHRLIPEGGAAAAEIGPEQRDLPPGVRSQLEDIQRRAGFEMRAEGREVTPVWVRRELLDLAAGQAIERGVRAIIALGESLYVDATARLRTDGRYAEAAVLLIRSREFLSKLLGYHLGLWEKSFEAFTGAPVNRDLPWPRLDWPAIRQGLIATQRRLEEAQASLIAPLSMVTKTPGQPDFLGVAVHESGKAAFEAMRRNDKESVRKIFPLYLAGVFALQGDLRSAVAGSPAVDQAVLVTEPVVDAIELSGLAYAWSEFHQEPPLWEPVTKAWDVILDSNPHLLAYLDAAMAVRRSEIRVPPRSAYRMGWRIILDHAIKQLPREEGRGDAFGREEWTVRHPSALIREMGGEVGGLIRGGEELFARKYLRRKPGAEDMSFGLSAYELEDPEPGEST